MSTHDDFFIGWADRVPSGHGGFLARIGLGFLALMLLLALALPATMDDAGGGGAEGERTLRGVITAKPYALLHMAPDAAHPAGHMVILSVVGKYPVQVPPALEGRMVEAKGWLFRRGSMDMLQMFDLPVAADGAAPAPAATEKLGTWRLTGEICDGQCYVGAMKPGTGIAHRACANFCLQGGIPPVFVTTAPIAGTSFLLMGGPDGALPARAHAYVGLRVRLDGTVERRGDILVFTPDLRTAMLP
jgi:hypothetical protein